MTQEGVRNVLIVGGGVGGMSAAIRLRALGIAVDLIDIDPHWRATGAGLSLNSATLRAFARLGILEDVAREGHIHAGVQIFDRRNNKVLEVPPYVPAIDDVNATGGILRPVLHGILSRKTRAHGVHVRLGLTLQAFSQDADGVDVDFSDETTGRYDLVVGSDGIMSILRQLAFPNAQTPQFTGQGCWRAVFRRPQEVVTARMYGDRTFKLGFNPVSEEEMYMFLLETAEGNPWRDPSEWVELLKDRMVQCAGLPRELAGELTEKSLVNYRPLETLLLQRPWHVGRVVLLGDAAHATTPHVGYGAGLSIEDGIVLAECLEHTQGIADALKRYEARRFPRCRTILEGSLAIGRLEMAGADLERQIAATMTLMEATRSQF